MGKSQPGGYFIGTDGRPHDAWNRPVEEGVEVLNPPANMNTSMGAVPVAGTQPIGGMLDTPFPGSDQYRAAEERIRVQLEANAKERERLAQEADKLRQSMATPVDLHNLRQMLASLSSAAVPRSTAGDIGPSREELKERGENWQEQEEDRLDKLREQQLAVDTNRDDPAKLEEGGQTKGASEMDTSKIEKESIKQAEGEAAERDKAAEKQLKEQKQKTGKGQ